MLWYKYIHTININMNNYTWTFEDVLEIWDNYNSNNSSNKKNIVSDTINKFKSKLLGIISTNTTKTTKNHKVVDFYDAKNTRSVFLSSEERKTLFTRLTRNQADISKLKNNLKWEKNLLWHFEKIARFIPGWAEKIINWLKNKITQFEDMLIKLEIQNIKINAKLNPFEKDDMDWESNIFNANNKVEPVNVSQLEKIEVNIKRLKTKLEFEKNLLAYFKNLSGYHKDEIEKFNNSIKEIEDHLIALEIQKLKLTQTKKVLVA